MAIYNKKNLPHPEIWDFVTSEHGRPIECAVDVWPDTAVERLAWLDAQNINYYFVPDRIIFFETEADGITYYLRWASEDKAFE